VRAADGPHEPASDGRRDLLRDDRSGVLLRVLLLDQGGGAVRRRRHRSSPGLRPRPAVGSPRGDRVTMDIAARIQQLEDRIREAKSMPLSASALLNREELLEIVTGLKEALPEEIKQARWVVKDREELLTKARGDAESVMQKARA